jgi:hypothetical protein
MVACNSSKYEFMVSGVTSALHPFIFSQFLCIKSFEHHSLPDKLSLKQATTAPFLSRCFNKFLQGVSIKWITKTSSCGEGFNYFSFLNKTKGIYQVLTLKVEHRQLTLCIQFIGIMSLFLYISY